MSVLNQASDGQFNVLIALVRASVRFGPRERAELLAICGADALGVDSSKLNSTFIRWHELGLFEAPDGSTVLSEPYRKRLGKDPDKAEAGLQAVAREIVLKPENNQRFWEAKENKSADLTRALAWLLAQDVYAIDTSSHKAIEKLERDQVREESKLVLQNDTRWNGLKAWATYLGFGRGDAFMVDPTLALRDVLPDVLPNSSPITARDFLGRVVELLPVLDDGIYRQMVEGVLDDKAWSKPAENRLSTSLSRAIERLAQAGELAIEQKADAADGLQLTGVNGRLWRSFTHVWRPAQTPGARR